MNILKALCHLKMTLTFAEGRRLIHDGAVFVNDKPVCHTEHKVFHRDVVRVGKKRVEEVMDA